LLVDQLPNIQIYFCFSAQQEKTQQHLNRFVEQNQFTKSLLLY